MASLFSDFLSGLMAFQYFHFMRPYWLLVIIPTLWILKNLTARDDSLALWRKMMSSEILEQLTVQGNSNNLFSPKKITWLSAALVCIVLAGPSWQQQPSPFTEDSSALIIALDVSESMDQSDVQPSRLLRAKQKIIELLAIRGDANTALIAFSGSAHIVMPITNDSEMIRHFLDALDHNLMPVSGKLPQAVLPLAGSLLQSTEVPGTLLVMGDGATSETATEFSAFFEQQKHQLIVWAIGDSNRVANPEDDSSIIPMQLSQLNTLADVSQGRLVLMTHDKQDIDQVNRYIENNLVVVDDESRPWKDAGFPLVFIISALFLLWFRRGWTLQW